MDSKTLAMLGGIALALLVTIPLPIYVTRRRLRNEWARYEAQEKAKASANREDSADE